MWGAGAGCLCCPAACETALTWAGALSDSYASSASFMTLLKFSALAMDRPAMAVRTGCGSCLFHKAMAVLAAQHFSNFFLQSQSSWASDFSRAEGVDFSTIWQALSNDSSSFILKRAMSSVFMSL